MIAESPPFSLLTTRIDGISVIRAIGDVDVSTCADFEEPVERELARRPAGIVLDLRKIRFFGSSGLQVLLRARAAAQAQHIGLCLVADHPVVLRPLEISGLTELFTIRTSVPEAVTALAT